MKIYYRSRFAAAHRLPGHPKCGVLHGHNYIVEIWIDGPVQKYAPVTGMVTDFGLLKEIVKQYDHKCILFTQDTLANATQMEAFYEMFASPTCENLATEILEQVLDMLPKGAEARVRVWEDEDSWAEEEGICE